MTVDSAGLTGMAASLAAPEDFLRACGARPLFMVLVMTHERV